MQSKEIDSVKSIGSYGLNEMFKKLRLSIQIDMVRFTLVFPLWDLCINSVNTLCWEQNVIWIISDLGHPKLCFCNSYWGSKYVLLFIFTTNFNVKC